VPAPAAASAKIELHKSESEHEEEADGEAAREFTAMVRDEKGNPPHLCLLSNWR